MAVLKTFGDYSKNSHNFKITALFKITNMLSRPVIVILLIALSLTASAQQASVPSMLPEVSYPMLQKLVDTAIKYYPRIKVYEHKVNAATVNVKKAKLGWFDLFTFSFLYSPNNSTTLVNPSILNGYQVGAFFNLGSLLQKPSLIKQAKEELSSSQYERDEYYVNLTALVKERYFLYIQQVALLKLKLNAETDAQSNLEMTKHKFEKGEMTLDDYNKALSNYVDHNQAKIESEGSLLVAKASLEELVGKRLEDIH